MENDYKLNLSNLFNERIKDLIKVKSFYKYLDLEGGKEALKNNTLKFSAAISFDDITECRSSRLNTEIKTITDKANFFSRITINSYYEVIKISREISRLINISKPIDENIINRFGICCLSTLEENQFLWNYDKIKHNGICLEYEAISLRKFLREKLKVNNNFYLFCPAIYLDTIQKVDYDIGEGIKITILNWFFVKEIDPYSNEHEVRIVSNFDSFSDRLIYLPKSILKNVYVGKNVSDDDYVNIQKIIDNQYGNKVGLIRNPT